MGAPVSDYTIIRALSTKPINKELQPIRKAMEVYNLYAFILHDPEVHKDFNETLVRNFDHLDYNTGRKLMFFALIDPPDEWLEHVRGRPYYEAIENWEVQEFLHQQAPIHSGDKSMSVFAMANALNIPYEDLPCIVLTINFRLKKFLTIKTCPEHLVEQFGKLGYIAERFRNIKPRNLDNQEKLFGQIREADINLCDGIQEQSLQEAMGNALIDLLSFVIVRNDGRFPMEGRDAYKRVRLSLTKLQKQLKEIKAGQNENDIDPLFEELATKIAMFLSQLSYKNFKSLPVMDKNFLEPDSLNFLRTAYNVIYFLREQSGEQHDYNRIPVIRGDMDLDYTPGVICMAKAFEKEINLSIVHWIRREKGISLPEYFSKWQPDIKAEVLPDFMKNPKPIDVNKRNKERWLPPGIGESKLAAIKMGKGALPEDWTKNEWKELLKQWEIITYHRNKAAHSEIVGFDRVAGVEEALKQMANKHLFEKLYSMKCGYRGLVT